MSARLKRIDGLGGHGSRFFRASVKGAPWLPLRLPIRYQKGLKPPLLATRIRRKYLALSAGYELLSKLQNLPARGRLGPSLQILLHRGLGSDAWRGVTDSGSGVDFWVAAFGQGNVSSRCLNLFGFEAVGTASALLPGNRADAVPTVRVFVTAWP